MSAAFGGEYLRSVCTRMEFLLQHRVVAKVKSDDATCHMPHVIVPSPFPPVSITRHSVRFMRSLASTTCSEKSAEIVNVFRTGPPDQCGCDLGRGYGSRVIMSGGLGLKPPGISPWVNSKKQSKRGGASRMRTLERRRSCPRLLLCM